MTGKKAKSEKTQINVELTLGQRLKTAREAQNLAVVDVADRLRLSPNVIQLIETDNYQQEKITTFIRGYIRNYARLLKLSEQEVNVAFERLGLTVEAERYEPLKFNTRQSSIRDKPIKLFTYSVIVILITLVLTWRYLHRADNSVVITPAAQPAATISETPVTSTVPTTQGQTAPVTPTQNNTQVNNTPANALNSAAQPALNSHANAAVVNQTTNTPTVT